MSILLRIDQLISLIDIAQELECPERASFLRAGAIKKYFTMFQIATDPRSITGVGKWDSPYAIGVRNGVEIRVDFYPPSHSLHSGKISMAYPINIAPNP